MARLLIGFIVFFGLLAGVVTGGRVLENHPSFCNSCHEMNRPHDGWISSGASHSHLSCMDCHSGAGVTGVIEAELRGFGQLIEHFALSEKELKGPFIAKVPKEFCLKCHRLQLSRTAKAHRPFKIEGKECSRCHRHQDGWEFAGEIRKDL
ncbi:MAG: NapC/NirT family cytochrome c [Nitrospirae bacterium]|nr:NapC/NirT family cytochrome c [Nitrospirota bacterium]MBI3351844.1 NapC/NirT family cytochrome c [Nitrospirota bacterium]